MNVNDSIAQRVRDHYKGKFGWVVAWYKRQDPDDFWFGPISAELPDWNDCWDNDPSLKYFIVEV